ncbi:MAG TPA: hypothetical protein PKX12_17370 [Spirochaetota bacterium]|nr:hypothetical protein [Spirochaetota bacterium]
MKMILVEVFAACFIISGMPVLFPCPVQSATLGIGASGWYAWWKPEPEYREADADPDFLYGPQLLLQFSQSFSVSTVFLMGKFKYYDEYNGETSTSDITRYDSDTTLTYTLNRYVRIFGGVKFMGYDYSAGSHYGLGPGLGFGLVIPLMEKLFGTVSFSGLYLWGEQTDESSDGDRTMKFIEYGFNNSVSLVYAVSSSVHISLGGRYFFFRYESTEDQYSDIKEKHHFYGVTASAMYLISI